MARSRVSMLVVVAALAAACLTTTARAQTSFGGLAGDSCDLGTECMSKTCGGDGTCVATTCGLDPTMGGIGPNMPTGYCSSSQKYNPQRVCTFGFGRCAKSECCDTVTCGAGVSDIEKSTYCTGGKTFAAVLLCPGGVCSKDACCITTRCDSPGGVPVNKRATFCPAGQVFNNLGVCTAGQGKCAPDNCCALDTRACGVVFTEQGSTLTCPIGSNLVDSRIFNPNAGTNGGCCETTTCATGVADSAKNSFCKDFPGTAFTGVPTCLTGNCEPNDCCKPPTGYCEPGSTKQTDSSCTCDAGDNKAYVLGYGCGCSPGYYFSVADTPGVPNSGTCTECPYGTYTGSPNVLTACSACPDNQPWTPTKHTDAADKCINYCDTALATTHPSGVCTNGGVCKSEDGDPANKGSYSCTCPSSWMFYGTGTTPSNCDAATTLLRLRILPGPGVIIPSAVKLLVSETPVGTSPSYALAAPAGLACAVDTPSSSPLVPACTGGGVAMSSTVGTAAETYKAVGTKVKLSSNYNALVDAGSSLVPDKDFLIQWVCSDGSSSDTKEMEVVLPGPTNTANRQTLVCTAIVIHADTGPPIKLKLAAGSVVPLAADATQPAALTFYQETAPGVPGPICSLNVPALGAAEAAPVCAYYEQPFTGGKKAALGVANIDMEKYKLSWSCSGGPVVGTTLLSLTTTVDGDAVTPELPVPGQTSLVCLAKFEDKKSQMEFTVASTEVSVPVKILAMQTGMNEACVAKIPANTAANTASILECPVSNMASGVLTDLTTDADLTKYLVSFSCVASGAGEGSGVVAGPKSVKVKTTPNGGATSTTCSVTISPLPALLTVKIQSTVALVKDFKVFASQDAADTCVVNSGATGATTGVDCGLKAGMMPGVKTTLTPRALDANRYELKWDCVGAATGAFVQLDYSNVATVVLNANPNLGGAKVICTGTVVDRNSPVTVLFNIVESAVGNTDVATAINANNAEVRVRQAHQSKACTAVKPIGAQGVKPTCEFEGLKPDVGTTTTLSTGNIDLSKFKVSWSCSDGVPVTLVAAGVASAPTRGNGLTTLCSAKVENKPPVLTLASSSISGTPPANDWRLSARQTSQGRACTVVVAGGSAVATSPAAPMCEVHPLSPQRSTVLTAAGLDASRFSVTWACKTFLGVPISTEQTKSATGAVVENSATLTMDKDANTGGGPVACVADVAPRISVLKLKAVGLTGSDWALTAKQAAQSQACTVAPADAVTGAAPACPAGTIDFSAGLPVDLGVTGIPATSRVTWACISQLSGIGAASVVAVANGNAGAASVTPSSGTGAVTTCTATVVSATTPFLQIKGVSGLTFTASTQVDATLCTSTTDASLTTCPAATANALTKLVVTGVPETSIARFACQLGTGTNVPVAKTSGFSASVLTPTAIDTMICTLTVVAKPPILTVTSNLPTVLTAVQEGGVRTCTSLAETNKLVCDSGTGSGQLEATKRVSLSQVGLTAAGYYRWSCASSKAGITRQGSWTEATGANQAKATITLPAEEGALTCSLTFSTTQPALGRLRRMLML